MKLFLDCRSVAARLSASQDAALSLGAAVRLRWHLVGCRGCRNAGRQLRLIRAATKRLQPLPEQARADPRP